MSRPSKGIPTFYLFLLLISTIAQDTVSTRKTYRVRANRTNERQSRRVARGCTAHSDPQLHILMDQICELCHEMFSHVQPNLRANCSERCYKNNQYRKCLRMFSALPPGHPGGKAFTEILMRMDREEEDQSEGKLIMMRRRRKHRSLLET